MQLKQDITLLSGIGLLSTTLLGTGLFMVPAIAAGIAGSASLWAWFVLLLAVCPIALTFAELGKRYPNAGGTAFFVRQAFGAKFERAVAWLFLSVIPVGIPAGVTLAASFLQHLLPAPFDGNLTAQLLTITVVLLVNLRGSQSSGRLQMMIALGICALMIAFFYQGGLSFADLSMPKMELAVLPATAKALGVMFWCFVGIEAFAHMGEEFKNPERDFPLAVIIGCLLAGVIYWLCSVVIIKFHAYGQVQFDSGSILWLSSHLFGDSAAWVISLLGFLACFASLNLYAQSLSRMVWAQARQNNPQGKLLSLNKRGVPFMATLLVCGVLAIACSVVHLLSVRLDTLLSLANSAFILIYLFAMAAAVKLLKGWGRGLAVVAFILCAIVFVCLGWAMSYALIIIILLLWPIILSYFKKLYVYS